MRITYTKEELKTFEEIASKVDVPVSRLIADYEEYWNEH